MSKFTQGRFALSLHLNLSGDEVRPLKLPRVSPTQVCGNNLKTLSSWAPSYSAVPDAPWALTNYHVFQAGVVTTCAIPCLAPGREEEI